MAAITQKILTTNNCYKAGVNRSVTKGLMVHSVGCPQPSADVFCRLWAQNANTVCPNAIVDATHCYQLLPWGMKAWHACDPANSTYVGVETTEPSTIEYKNGKVIDHDPVASKKHIDAVYANTVQLFAYLCKQYGFDPMEPGRVISHAEGAKMGIASAHADPDHLWPKYGYTMSGFRADVKAAMGGVTPPAPTPTPTPTPLKPVDVVALEVIRGEWGAGAERKKRLTDAGYDYNVVQNRVNEILAGSTPKKSLDAIAIEVIQGKWSAGAERKKLLTEAGYDYDAVQKRVNELLGMM